MEKKVGLIGLLLSLVSVTGFAEDRTPSSQGRQSAVQSKIQRNTKVIYPKKTQLDFEGAQIEGELKNPGEFYFQHRPEEKFDSLIKRRKNFHKEMMRDVVLSK